MMLDLSLNQGGGGPKANDTTPDDEFTVQCVREETVLVECLRWQKQNECFVQRQRDTDEGQSVRQGH